MRKNLIANYGGAIVMVLAPTLALPWYLSALGSKQFGLVSFITMLQGLLAIIDVGMSQALIREFSIRFQSENEDGRNVASLLYGFERIYWAIGFAVALCLVLFSSQIASHWLVLDGLTLNLGQQAILGAAAIFLAQFPGLIYRSLMQGAQAQVGLNSIVISGLALRHLGGVLALSKFPSVLVYIAWNVFVSLLETSVRAFYAWKLTGQNRGQTKWNKQLMQSIQHGAMGFTTAVFIGSVTVQVDKIVVSKMLSVEQFGYYMIAVTVSGGVLQVIYPLASAIIPKAVQLRDDGRKLRLLLMSMVKVVALIVLLGCLGYFFIGKWALFQWLRTWMAVQSIHPVLTLLLIGSALNAFYNVGYIYWIVHGRIGRVLLVNGLSFMLSLFLIPALVLGYGLVGAASGWIAINLMGFVISLEWLWKLNDG